MITRQIANERGALAVIALLLFAPAVSGCGGGPRLDGAVAGPRSADRVEKVETVKPVRRTIVRSVEQPGSIEPIEQTAIHAKISGYVEKWLVDIGASVKKGDPLAILSDPEIDGDFDEKSALVGEAKAKVEQAKANQAVAAANVASAVADLDLARAGARRADADIRRWSAELKRVNQLFGEHTLTGTLLDETKSKLAAAESTRDEVGAGIKSAEATVKRVEAAVLKAETDTKAAEASLAVAVAIAAKAKVFRGYETLVAPFDGIITERNVDLGDLTTAGPSGEPLFKIARADLVRVVVGVPEIDAPWVNPHDSATVRAPAIPGKAFAGKVARTSWRVDPIDRTLRVEIELPVAETGLRPGLYAKALIALEEHNDAVVIPRQAVIHIDNASFCLIAGDGVARRVDVKTGFEDAEGVEISQGLSGNEDVIISSQASIRAGSKVIAVPKGGL